MGGGTRTDHARRLSDAINFGFRHGLSNRTSFAHRRDLARCPVRRDAECPGKSDCHLARRDLAHPSTAGETLARRQRRYLDTGWRRLCLAALKRARGPWTRLWHGRPAAPARRAGGCGPTPDHSPVTHLFFFIAPSPRAHLDLLGRLVRTVAQEALRDAVQEDASDWQVFAAVAAMDRTISESQKLAEGKP